MTTQTFDPCARLKEAQRYQGRASLKFRRVERECEYNVKAEESGAPKLYDFEVVIDGAVRCVFKTMGKYSKRSWGRYQLFDCEGRAIHSIRETRGHWPKHFGLPAEKQADFESIIGQCLYDMLIPTIREQKAETERLGHADEALRIECETAAQTLALQGLARDMFESLARVIAVAEDQDAKGKDFTPAERNAAIAQARMTYFAAHAAGARAIEGEREHRQIYLQRSR